MSGRLLRKWKLLGLGGGVVAAWNTADKTAGMTLSGSDLTVTNSTGAGQRINALPGRSSGKYVFAFDPTVIAGAATYETGVRTNAASSGTMNGIGHIAFNGQVTRYVAGASTVLTAASSYTVAASEVQIAVDLDAKLFWLRVGSGNWNNSATANPATGTEGRDFSAAGAGTYYPFFNSGTATAALTMNFGGAAFANALPSGFSAWQG